MAACTHIITELGDDLITEDSAFTLVTEDSNCAGAAQTLFDYTFSMRPAQGQIQPMKWA